MKRYLRWRDEGHLSSNGRCFDLMAVNLGHDADTTAAICGMLAGAVYGVEGIPVEWRRRVVKAEVIEGLAKKLAGAAPA